MANDTRACGGRFRSVLPFLLVPFFLFCGVNAGEAPGTQPAKAISADGSEVGKLLRLWAAEGTAAGNTGDWYDNRDGAHSMLDVRPSPQLSVVKYSDEDVAARRHWAFQTRVLPQVVFGNSSTSASPFQSGSNPRSAYCQRAGMELLAQQYRGNNLYIYPEHRDHDVEDDPDGGGYGDLFPTNTPYVIISQGSSGSDQPFMRAMPPTLAAFRPDVKAALVRQGLLMPAVQLILRSSMRRVVAAEDYLKGFAHPTVFEGSQVDALRMVKMAHAMTADRLPPLAQVRLVESEPARPGRDYFDPFESEIHARTPQAIAHIFRGLKQTRKLVVTAEDSFDANGRAVTYHWVVLRGDPAKVRLTPLNAAKSRVEISIGWHERAPVEAGKLLMSSRVDIGVFVHNGTWYSPPAFVTSYCMPCEARTYGADGRLLEIGYGHGLPKLAVKNWTAFLEAARVEPLSTPMKLLLGDPSAAQLAALRELAVRYRDAAGFAEAAQKAQAAADAALAKEKTPQNEAAAKAAREKARVTATLRDNILLQKLAGMDATMKDYARRKLGELAANPELFLKHAEVFPPLPAEAKAMLKRLAAMGVIRDADEKKFALLPLLEGDGPAAQRLSLYQRGRLTAFHAELLARSIPGVGAENRRFLVDFRLTRPKEWRDVYQYTAEAILPGWRRYTEAKVHDFTAEGLVILERDGQGRCIVAAPVEYEVVPPGEKRPAWDWPAMSFKVTDKRVRFEYANEKDVVGKPVLTSP